MAAHKFAKRACRQEDFSFTSGQLRLGLCMSDIQLQLAESCVDLYLMAACVIADLQNKKN